MKLPYPKEREKKCLESRGGGSFCNKLMLCCVDREEFASALKNFAMMLVCSEKAYLDLLQYSWLTALVMSVATCAYIFSE